MPANASFDTTYQQAQLQPQFDWSSLIGPIVTSVLSALSTSPQLSQSMRPQSAGPGQLQPQFDWSSLIGPIVTSVLSALSTSPQLSQTMRPQSAGPDQLQPQFRPQSAGQGQLQPQFDWGSLVGTIVPIVLSVLSTSPQLSQMMRPQQTAASVLH
jgi:hypothetical protein